MNRKEEITNKLLELIGHVKDAPKNEALLAVGLDIAEWADKHPRKDLVEINKIYIWLSDFLDKCYIEDKSTGEEINIDSVLKSFLNLKVEKEE